MSVPDERNVRAIKLTEGLRVYPYFTAHATGPALPFDVDLEAKFAKGQFRVQKLTALKRHGQEGITTDGLRRIPVGRILQQAIGRIVVGSAIAQFAAAAGSSIPVDSSLYLQMVANVVPARLRGWRPTNRVRG